MALSLSQAEQRSPSESSSETIGQRFSLNSDTPYNTERQLDWKREYKNTVEKVMVCGFFPHSHMSKFEAVQHKVRIQFKKQKLPISFWEWNKLKNQLSLIIVQIIFSHVFKTDLFAEIPLKI